MPKYRNLVLLAQKYFFAKEPQKAIEFAQRSLKIKSNNSYIYDILAESYMLIGDETNAKIAGVYALQLKEIQNSKYHKYPYPSTPIKPFNRKNKSQNIISFSLFGDNPKYCENAIINATLAPTLYPSWKCRFYCDTKVPKDVIKRLQKYNVEIILKATPKDRSEMFLWRFLVMGDQKVERYIVRDCDAVINTKESRAVEEWIASGKRFHIMRDFYTHTDLILAGMFGGTTDIFPNIKEMIRHFNRTKQRNRSHQDQLFLREYVWETIKSDCLIHDSHFRYGSTKPFPPHPPQPKAHHVGKNEGAVEIRVKPAKRVNKEQIRWGIYDKQGVLICAYSSKIVEGVWKSHIPMAYALKIEKREYFIRSNI